MLPATKQVVSKMKKIHAEPEKSHFLVYWGWMDIEVQILKGIGVKIATACKVSTFD